MMSLNIKDITILNTCSVIILFAITKNGERNWLVVMKWKFHHHKNLILLEYVDAGSVLISTMDSSGKKKKFYWFQRK